MNEQKNIEQDTEPIELLDENLDDVAAGKAGDGIGGVNVGIRKKPGGQAS